ncbi:hypothetical protein [Rhizobium sp. R339]|uniref:hypothetical protein n=1 Tax=Rhizobium sp. R339 TaxID=1764273 RepID=UPI000B52CC61|nr:hypothetical protein [Rhizobium sp. R339]
MNLPSKEDARLCAGVVREVARAKGINGHPAPMGRLTATVARLFSMGIRDRDRLLSEAMAAAEMPVVLKEHHSIRAEPLNFTPGTIDLSLEPEYERGHQHQ